MILGAAISTGALGVATLMLAQRHLELAAFAPLAQLWTIWAVLAAGLTFSFQQWAAVHNVGRRSLLPGGSSTRILGGLLLMGLSILVVTTVFRETFFGSPAMVWPVSAAVLPIGTGFNGVRRGQLARHRQRRGLAAVIAGENGIRLLVTLALVQIDAGPEWFAAALLAGFLVVLGPTGGTSAVTDGPERPGVSTLGAAAMAGFLAHAFMFGSPLLLALAGGEPTEVAALFLVLTGVRLPFLALQAIVPQLAVSLAAASDRGVAIAQVRRSVLLVAVVGTAGAVFGGLLLGDVIIGSIFDIRGVVADTTYGLLAGASVLAACALIATVALVVEGRSARIMVAWAVPAASAAVVTAGGVIEEPTPLATWLFVAHASVVALTLVPPLNRRDDGPPSRTHAVPSPRDQ